VRAAVYAPDRQGLFADVAGIAAEIGGTVWGASAFPLAPPGGKGPDRAVTIVEMLRPGTPPELYALAEGEAARIEARLVEIARDGAPPPRLPGASVTDRRSVFTVPPRVRLFPGEAPDALIVEAEGLDRPGLLHLLAEEIEAAGASVRRAFVATKGERAIDTFYLQDERGEALSDEAAIGRLVQRLEGVLTA
jgi:[protein-PII] uridylyltransferase